MKNLHLNGKAIQFFPKGCVHVAMPLKDQLEGWDEVIESFVPPTPDPWIVSSIVTSMTGAPRPNTSHEAGWAIDFAPIASWDHPLMNDGSKSPLLFDNMPLVQCLYSNFKSMPSRTPLSAAWVVENDHIHFGFGLPPGIYLLKDYYKYPSDSDGSHPSTPQLLEVGGRDDETLVFNEIPLPSQFVHPFYLSR